MGIVTQRRAWPESDAFVAALKLAWVCLQVRLGRKAENTTLRLTVGEHEELLQLAAQEGYRALVVALQQVKVRGAD